MIWAVKNTLKNKSLWISSLLLLVSLFVSFVFYHYIKWVQAAKTHLMLRSHLAHTVPTIAETNDLILDSHPNNVPVPADTYAIKKNDTNDKTLATMFITIKDEITPFQYSALRNWPLMCNRNFNINTHTQDSIRLVLFVSEKQHNMSETKKFIDKAKEIGWIVLNYTETTKEGTPFLKALFIDVLKHFQSTFYGYSNSDILLGVNNFCKTLKAIRPFITKFNSILIAGRRTSIDMKNRLFFEQESVEWAAMKEGRLAKPHSMEYFISDGHFPWCEVKNVAVGRLGIDNYMIYFALSQKTRITLIDGTSTITALEQRGLPGNLDNSYKTKAKDKFHNVRMYPSESVLGFINNARYETKFKDRKMETIGIYDKLMLKFLNSDSQEKHYSKLLEWIIFSCYFIAIIFVVTVWPSRSKQQEILII